MVVVAHCPNVADKNLSVFRTTDSLLSDDPVVVLYGLSTTLSASGGNNSRIQCHVFTPVGFQSYPRLAVSPNSPLYRAVECLPREEQGDEVCRGLAFGILKYFSELPEIAKEIWTRRSSQSKGAASDLHLFSASHAAILASRMVKMIEPDAVLRKINAALLEQTVSVIDASVLLPESSNTGGNSLDHDFTGGHGAKLSSNAEYDPLLRLIGKRLSRQTSKPLGAENGIAMPRTAALFTKKQKEKLRLEMCELVDTEGNYVNKLHELQEISATFFHANLDNKTLSSTKHQMATTEAKFLSSLKAISGVNRPFLEAIQQTLDATENTAIEDIETTPELKPETPKDFRADVTDVTGTVAFAQVLIEWFHKFVDCYTNYIESYPNFVQRFRCLVNEQAEHPGRPVHDTRDQRLMSLLIEPIQRLPRYSLYVDNIITQLPENHPALEILIMTKSVIAEVCSKDSIAQENLKLVRLKRLISSWPSKFNPCGRLITVSDADVIEPPYTDFNNRMAGTEHWLLLLFSDYILLAKNDSGTNGTARSLIADLDTAPVMNSSPTGCLDFKKWKLTYVDHVRLSDVDFCEVYHNRMIRISPTSSANETQVGSTAVRVCKLRGEYEGKAAQWIADAIKARIEARMLASCLDASQWEIRQYDEHESTLQLLSTVSLAFRTDNQTGPGKYAPIVILINPNQYITKIRPGRSGIEILATIIVEDNGFFQLSVEAMREKPTRDLVTAAEFMPVLLRRIGNLLQSRYQIRNVAVTENLILHNYSLLRSIMLDERLADRHADRSRKTRPASPVKALSNLFGGVSLREPGFQKKPLPSVPVLTDIPRLAANPKNVKSISEPDLSKDPTRTLTKVLASDMVASNTPSNHIEALENTFSSYILALGARKGNIVGKVLNNRAQADEREVKNLYEDLLSGPSDHERAAQTSVDVLFMAFEKFIKQEWNGVMGPIIDTQTLQEIQLKAELLSPLEYEDYMLQAISELAPQNQRALRAIVYLLTDLLDHMGNDGDRGSLTAAVTEIIVCDESPHSFIPLFDRLVADHELVGDSDRRSGAATPSFASLTPTQNRSVVGTTDSKTPSFSRRFGFGSLNRQNSKTETPAIGSVSKLWSKGGRSADYSLKELLSPSKSGLFDERAKTMRSARFPQYSNVTDVFSAEHTEVFRNPAPGMPTIGKIDLGSPFSKTFLAEPTEPIKKKRRSSLSDLKLAKIPDLPTPLKTPMSRIPDAAPQLPRPVQASPLTPSISFATALGTSSPRRSESTRHSSPRRQENTPPIAHKYQTLRERPVSYRAGERSIYSKKLPQVPVGTGFDLPQNSKLRRSPSLIPVPRAVLIERKSSGNALSPVKQPSLKSQAQQAVPPAISPVKKPHLVSPQKLSDQLGMQQNAITETDLHIRLELEHLQTEHSQLSMHFETPPMASYSPQKHNAHLTVSNISTRLKALESKIPHLIGNLQTQTTVLEGHVSDLLLITEKKLKVLDAKLRRSNEENAVLYERNNDELMRVFDQVRGGRTIEELTAKLKESMREAEMWKRECMGLGRKGVAGIPVAVDGADNEGVVRAGERLREVTRAGL